MKREEFLITSTVGHNVVKHAWNSANREVEKLLQEYANEQADSTTWELVEKTSEKEGFYFVSGSRVWQSDKGQSISFFITKIA